MKIKVLTVLGMLSYSSFSFGQNANNTTVQGGGSMSGTNSGSSTVGQGTSTSQENHVKNSNSQGVEAGVRGTANSKSSYSGNPIPAADRSKQYTDALKQVLKLNDDQYGKMKMVNTDFIKQIDKLTQTSKDNVSFQQGIMEADKVRVDKYKGLLNAKQLKMYVDNPQLSGLSGNNEAVRTDNGKPENENVTQQTESKNNSASENKSNSAPENKSTTTESRAGSNPANKSGTPTVNKIPKS